MSYTREKEIGIAFANAISRENVMRFDALECRLFGKIEKTHFGPWDAVSGAGLNTSKALQGTKLSAWLPSKVTTGKEKTQRGGVIPAGWWIALPEILRRGQTSSYIGKGAAPTDWAIKLVPFQLSNPNPEIFGLCARGGFYIHGASKDESKIGSGSDGCILLPLEQRKSLSLQISKGKGAWLFVFLNAAKINEMIELQSMNSNIA